MTQRTQQQNMHGENKTGGPGVVRDPRNLLPAGYPGLS